ncbi:iron uptake porin [Aetokthonos hydrillicola Thurmond2011]|jgi:hypothetical protein|uniref:Iron uptake porin n=1 Tax=Aetokthonos hydrillicola Thurmond2011 TaxID=2712845 RepID=A0AAP5I7V5_9CYAN|nr:iron uptake porin [Aetokthonos hydrillicola]MBO3461514.1 iron uptake porin [Aetokthonos hydrillicola CCALA 1050]MBW4584653.1 iron uptake porin [Aetokthonos hydrillicola CCALA 1050]MDR9895197.1 iron uptake porin [Aetokthonos hydrillicola Thurmond2011]
MLSFIRERFSVVYFVLIWSLSLIPISKVRAQDSPGVLSIDKSTDSLKEISQYTEQDSLPVTSVSQLSDVQPSDWAFGALQSLVERYGCIAGYPDRNFKGNRSMTRFEFAAALNTCLEKVNQLITTGTANLATKEDLATLQKLQGEFQPEIASLRARVDAIELHTAQLKADQFSTPIKSSTPIKLNYCEDQSPKKQPKSGVKLDAQLILAGVGSTHSGRGEDSNLAVADRVRLNVKTSFTGDRDNEELRARIQASNVINPIGPGRETRLSFYSGTDATNAAFLSKLDYKFPVGKRKELNVMLGTGFNTSFDDWEVINPLKDDGDAAISRFGRYSPIFRLGGDTGAGVTYNPCKHEDIKIQMVYLAGDKNANNPASGLFNGKYGVLGQIIYYPTRKCKDEENQNEKEPQNKCEREINKDTKIAFTYVNAYNDNGLGHNTGSIYSNLLGKQVSSNSFGIESNVKINKGFQLGGWVSYTDARVLSGGVKGNADIWSWAVTLALPKVDKQCENRKKLKEREKCSLGGVIIGMEPRLTGTSVSIPNLRRRDPDTGFHIEGFYRYQINDKISITPGLIWLTAPNHDSQNGNIFVGVLRTTFDIK